MIPSIIRFNRANHNLANKELIEINSDISGAWQNAIYKFNNYGRISGITSLEHDDNDYKIVSVINFIRDDETDRIVGIHHYLPHLKSNTLFEVNFDPLALAGFLRVFNGNDINEYSIFDNESEMLITDGYENHFIRYNRYGEIAQIYNEQELENTLMTYDQAGRLIRMKITCGGYYSTTVFYLYDENNIPVKTITLNNGGMYEVSYILS